jgi:lipopolysaccharide export system protein LptA
LTPVFKILLQSAAYFEAAITAYGEVSQIEQPVDIGSEQQSVRNLVLAAFTKGPYMGGIQDW